MPGPAGRHLSPWVDTMPAPQVGATHLREARPDVLVTVTGSHDLPSGQGHDWAETSASPPLPRRVAGA